MAVTPIKVPPPGIRSPLKSYGATEMKTTIGLNNTVSNVCIEQVLDITAKWIALLHIWDILCSDLGMEAGQPA
jgi:hypothetical protein